MSRYRHRRTFSPSTAFPSPVEPGELIVNTANRQLAVGDAATATLGLPKNLLAIRIFDTAAQYAAGDIVVQAGNIYKANAPISPGAFNGSNWTQLGVVTSVAANVVTFTPVGGVIATDVQGAITEVDAEKVAKAGDTMTGHLTLPTAPSAANAVRKDYVDNADTAVATAAQNSDSSIITNYQAADTALQTNINAKADKTYVDSQDALKAPIANPTFTGDPKAPTPTAGDNDTSIATTAFVAAAVAAAAPAVATKAEYLVGTDNAKMVTAKTAWDAAAPVTLTDGATVTPDFSTGIDFFWTLGAAGRTLANPTNAKPGQKGIIYLSQPVGGNATITTWGSAWKFPGGVKPTLTGVGNGLDVISYVVFNATNIMCSSAVGFA